MSNVKFNANMPALTTTPEYYGPYNGYLMLVNTTMIGKSYVISESDSHITDTVIGKHGNSFYWLSPHEFVVTVDSKERDMKTQQQLAFINCDMSGPSFAVPNVSTNATSRNFKNTHPLGTAWSIAQQRRYLLRVGFYNPLNTNDPFQAMKDADEALYNSWQKVEAAYGKMVGAWAGRDMRNSTQADNIVAMSVAAKKLSGAFSTLLPEDVQETLERWDFVHGGIHNERPGNVECRVSFHGGGMSFTQFIHTMQIGDEIKPEHLKTIHESELTTIIEERNAEAATAPIF